MPLSVFIASSRNVISIMNGIIEIVISPGSIRNLAGKTDKTEFIAKFVAATTSRRILKIQ